MAKEEKNEERRFVLAEVPTQYGNVIKDNETGAHLSEPEILIEIMNILAEVKKSVS